MFDFQQKRKLRSVVNSPLTQGVLLLLVLLVGSAAYVRYDIAMEMRERRQTAEQTAATLESRRDELAEEVDYLSNERGIEAELRRQFDVVREGEQVIVIVEEEPEGPVIEPLSTTTDTQEQPWYHFW
jgi:cell division protein FtsB